MIIKDCFEASEASGPGGVYNDAIDAFLRSPLVSAAAPPEEAAPSDFLNAGFEALERRPPGSPALGGLTTAELLAKASGAAGLLKTLGVQRRDVVLSMTGAIPEAVWLLLGALRHGATFGTLDPALPEPELEAALRRTRARLLVVESPMKVRVDPMRARLPELWHVTALERFGPPARMGAGDFLWGDYFDVAPHAAPAIPFRGKEPALVEPIAGTLWSHHVALAARRIGRLWLGEGRTAVDLPPSHRFWAVLGILAPLCAGGEVVLGDDPGAAARIGNEGDPLGAPAGWMVPMTRAGVPWSSGPEELLHAVPMGGSLLPFRSS